MTEHPQQETIKGLRALADFLEATPEVSAQGAIILNLFAATKEEFAAQAKLLAPCEKRTVGNWLMFTRRFGGGIFLELNLEHEKICEKVKVGEKVLPATEEQIIPAQPERIEPIYEWRCPPSLLANVANAE